MNYMIQHYLKTAIRNLLKYKTHSIILPFVFPLV
mgnify:CR=1 FL=1